MKINEFKSNGRFECNRRQGSSDKKRNLSLRLGLPFRCCFASSLKFSSSTVKQTKESSIGGITEKLGGATFKSLEGVMYQCALHSIVFLSF